MGTIFLCEFMSGARNKECKSICTCQNNNVLDKTCWARRYTLGTHWTLVQLYSGPSFQPECQVQEFHQSNQVSVKEEYLMPEELRSSAEAILDCQLTPKEECKKNTSCINRFFTPSSFSGSWRSYQYSFIFGFKTTRGVRDAMIARCDLLIAKLYARMYMTLRK